MVSYLPLTMIHPIVTHGNRVWLVCVHLYQNPFTLYQSLRYMFHYSELVLYYINTYQCSFISLSGTPCVTVWDWYYFLLSLAICVLLLCDSFLSLIIVTRGTEVSFIWSQIWKPFTHTHLLFPEYYWWVALLMTPRHFRIGLFINGTYIIVNILSTPSKFLWSTIVNGIFFIMASGSFTFITDLPIP